MHIITILYNIKSNIAYFICNTINCFEYNGTCLDTWFEYRKTRSCSAKAMKLLPSNR